jgi:hypothetical protein
MIISHKYKFIFLHVPKTAGSSVAAYFSQFLGDNDIMNSWSHSSKFGIGHNKKSLKLLNSKFALSMIFDAIKKRIKDGRILELPILDYALREVLKTKYGTESRHVPGKNIKKYHPKIWKNYFKFCFVRNPYAHAVSCWMWNENEWNLHANNHKFLKKKTKKNFTNFLKILKKKQSNKNFFKLPGNKIYTINDEICVDYIGKFETLNQDIYKIKRILKIPGERFKLPHEKKNNYDLNYLKYYNEENKNLVQEIWGKVFKLFDYKY